MSSATQEQAPEAQEVAPIEQSKPKKQRRPTPPNPNADLMNALFEDNKIISLAFAKRLAQLRKLGQTEQNNVAESVFDSLLALDKEYVAGLHTRFTEATKKQPLNTRVKRDPNAPAGHKNAFLCYSNSPAIIADVRQKYPAIGTDQLKLVSIIAVQWSKLTPAEKAIYEEESKQDRIRFNTEMEAYTANNGSSGSTIVPEKPRAKRSRAKKADAPPAEAPVVPALETVSADVPADTPADVPSAKTKRSRAKKTAP